jgi:hypothetical protein
VTLNVTTTETQVLSLTGNIEIRRAGDGWTIPAGTVNAKVSAGQPLAQRIALPHLRAGRYFVDTILKSAAGVETFAAGTFEVTRDVGVDKVELDRPYTEQGDKLAGKVSLRGLPPAGSRLLVRFRDAYDRVLSQQTIPFVAGRKEYPIAYTPDEFATIWMRAEATLIVDGHELDMKDASFTVPNRRHGRFNFLMWDTPTDTLGFYAWRQMKQAGISTCLIPSFFGTTQFHPMLAAADIPMVPDTTRFIDQKDANGVMARVWNYSNLSPTLCWNDEPAIDEYVKQIVNFQQKRREHGVFVYSLGDEGVTSGCCVAPTCLRHNRKT